MGDPTFDASAAVEIDLGKTISRLAGATEDLNTALEAMFERHAIPLAVSGAKAATANTVTRIGVGGPAVGRFWEIVTVNVIGSDDHTAVANTNVAFYVGAPATQGNLADLVLPGTQGGTAVTVPANAQFSRRQVIVQYPFHAYFLIYGAPGGQLLQANVRGWDRDVAELPLR